MKLIFWTLLLDISSCFKHYDTNKTSYHTSFFISSKCVLIYERLNCKTEEEQWYNKSVIVILECICFARVTVCRLELSVFRWCELREKECAEGDLALMKRLFFLLNLVMLKLLVLLIYNKCCSFSCSLYICNYFYFTILPFQKILTLLTLNIYIH